MADNIEKTWFVFRLSKILGPETLVSRSNQQGSNLPAKRSGTSVGIHWRMLWKQSALPRLGRAELRRVHLDRSFIICTYHFTNAFCAPLKLAHRYATFLCSLDVEIV